MREELSFYKELLNYQQQDGVTPLYLATQTGHLEAVKLLASHGADPTIKKINGLTPIHMASAIGDARMLDVLLRMNKHYTVDITDAQGITPAYIAAMIKSYDCLNLLKEYGAELHLAD